MFLLLLKYDIIKNHYSSILFLFKKVKKHVNDIYENDCQKNVLFGQKNCLQPLEILDFLSMTSILQAHYGAVGGI